MSKLSLDEKYMKEALKQAKKAAVIDEVPIGCVIVHEGKIIARGYNRRNKEGSTLAHAEIIAIKKASRKLNDWRLEECTMYVTLEPCPMCTGAIINARLSRVIFGAYDENMGACISRFNLAESSFGYKGQIIGGYMEKECADVLKEFFSSLRHEK